MHDIFDTTHLIVKATNRMGRGLFARQDIPKGYCILFRERLRVIPAELVGSLPEYDLAYIQQVGLWYYTAFDRPHMADDFANHSCEANMVALYDSVYYPNPRPYVSGGYVTVRDVREGEELTWDYSLSSHKTDESFECLCGSLRCRGIVGDFGRLDDDTRNKYINDDVVPDFIAKDLGIEGYKQREIDQSRVLYYRWRREHS